jgi:hypothetical protein
LDDDAQGLGVDHLDDDAQAVAIAPDAAFQQILDAQPLPDPGYVHVMPVQFEGRRP